MCSMSLIPFAPFLLLLGDRTNQDKHRYRCDCQNGNFRKIFPGPTNPIRSPRLAWSDTSSKSARPAKDFESCETVSIAESAQFPLCSMPGATRHLQSLVHRKSLMCRKCRTLLPEAESRIGTNGQSAC